MRSPRRRDSPASIAASAFLSVVFALYLVVLAALVSPSEEQWREADPILLLLPRWASIWSVPISSVGLAIFWWRVAKPDPATLRRSGIEAALGALTAVAVCGLVRVAVGPELPAFIPSEESARPGFLLSMTAGFAEELVFRLTLLPAWLFVFRRWLSERAAVVLAVILTGLGFTLLHQAGATSFEPRYFVTRFVIPGCAMSLAFLYIGPTFLVFAHGTAHLLIPALFR